MGGAFGSIAQSVGGGGSVLGGIGNAMKEGVSKIGKTLGPNGRIVNGTGGLSVGDAAKNGLSPADIEQMGTSANPYQRIVGGAEGFLGGMSGQQDDGGGGVTPMPQGVPLPQVSIPEINASIYGAPSFAPNKKRAPWQMY